MVACVAITIPRTSVRTTLLSLSFLPRALTVRSFCAICRRVLTPRSDLGGVDPGHQPGASHQLHWRRVLELLPAPRLAEPGH
jgi:hypothetical protein